MENIEINAIRNLSYGLFVLTSKNNQQDNGCIINVASQITESPYRIVIAVNKANLTHDLIKESGIFNLSLLTEECTMETIKHFGFQSGRNVNKFANFSDAQRSGNGLFFINRHTNAYISAKVVDSKDFESHTLFIAEVTEAVALSDKPSLTYAYYHQHIKTQKPAEAPTSNEGKAQWVCSVCGYVYEGDELPADFICPWCKHGADAFTKK